jgi:hypothetical protein
MEKRTNSPYPRIDRPVLAVVGLSLVVSTVLFARNTANEELLPARVQLPVAERSAPTRPPCRAACSRSGCWRSGAAAQLPSSMGFQA